MKWKAYWAALISALFGVVLWKNYRYYKDKSTKFKVAKSTVETALIASSAAWMPGILIVYGSAWATKPMERKPYIRMGLAAVASVFLILASTFALELLVLIGVFSVELLAVDYLRYVEERKIKRTGIQELPPQ